MRLYCTSSLRAFGSEEELILDSHVEIVNLYGMQQQLQVELWLCGLMPHVFKALHKLHKVTLHDMSAVKNGQRQELIFLLRSFSKLHTLCEQCTFLFVHL